MRLDSHQHFTAEYTPDLLLPILKRNRFEGSVVVCSPQDTAYHFQLASAHDFIRGVIAWVDLDNPNLGALLDDYQSHAKFRGVTGSTPTGSIPTGSTPTGWTPTGWTPTGSTPNGSIGCGLAELEARDLTFDLEDLALIPEIAGRYPRLRIVIDHLGRPPADPDGWARALQHAAQHPLVFGKVSGLITHCPTRWKAEDFRPYVQHALRAFGPHRLMFGSDWPSYLPEGTFKESLAAFTQSIGALPLAMREDLLGGTAERAYGL